MLACVHVVCILHMSKPGSARHAPGRKFQKLDMTIKNHLFIGIVGDLKRSELK